MRALVSTNQCYSGSGESCLIDEVLRQLLLPFTSNRDFHPICRVYTNEAFRLAPYGIDCNELTELLPLQTPSPAGTGPPWMGGLIDRYGRLDLSKRKSKFMHRIHKDRTRAVPDTEP